jgi:hypothetical protein
MLPDKKYILTKLSEAAAAALHDTELNQDAASYTFHTQRLVLDFETTIEVYLAENSVDIEYEKPGDETE